MEIVSAEQKKQYTTRPMKRQGAVRSFIMKLEPGETMLLKAQDWSASKRVPSYLIRRIEKESGRKFDCEKILSPGSGWLITRTA